MAEPCEAYLCLIIRALVLCSFFQRWSHGRIGYMVSVCSSRDLKQCKLNWSNLIQFAIVYQWPCFAFVAEY